MDEIDFQSDSFEDIVSRDARYDARAYALLADVLKYLFDGNKHVDAGMILDEFRERTLDQYGCMSYHVLESWGLERTEDVGEMMSNLVESHRIGADEGDNPGEFACGYDFRETFLGPYEA